MMFFDSSFSITRSVRVFKQRENFLLTLIRESGSNLRLHETDSVNFKQGKHLFFSECVCQTRHKHYRISVCLN